MYIVEKGEAKYFEFKSGKKIYKVPRRESLPVPKFREIRKRIMAADDPAQEGIDAIFDLFEEYAPGAFDNLTFTQALNIVNAYMSGDDDEGASLGESYTSSD